MKTKKILLTVVALLALTGAGCSKNNSNTQTSTNTTNTVAPVEQMKYKDFKLGITLYYPSDWKEQGQTNNITFYPKSSNTSAPIATNLTLTTQDLSKLPPVTLDQYTQIITDDSQKNLQKFTSINSEKTTIDGLEAGQITYTYTSPNAKNKILKVLHTYILKNKTAYLLTYTSDISTFDTYLSPVQDILKSFKFDN